MLLSKWCNMFIMVAILLTSGICGSPINVNVTSDNNKYTLNLTTIDATYYVLDNDELKLDIDLQNEWPPGFTFALTPSHIDIVSITDKHCKSDSGDEVLVIKKRDGYYSLTTVKKMNGIQCSFKLRTFFVVNNPTYKLSLTSSLFSPLTVDWSADMYEGNLDIGITPNSSNDPKTFSVLSNLTFRLNSLRKPLSGMYIPLVFTLHVETESMLNLGWKSFNDMNKFGTFFGECRDFYSSNQSPLKFHTVHIGNASKFPVLNLLVVVEVLDTSLNSIECLSTLRHPLSAHISIELTSQDLAHFINTPVPPAGGLERPKATSHYMSGAKLYNTTDNSNKNLLNSKNNYMDKLSDFFKKLKTNMNTDVGANKCTGLCTSNSRTNQFTTLNDDDDNNSGNLLNDMSHYTGSFSRLYMKPYYSELSPIHPYYTTVVPYVFGKDLFSQFTVTIGGRHPSCVVLKGLQNTAEQVTAFESQIVNNHPFLTGNYDAHGDEWKFESSRTGTGNDDSFSLYSTSTVDFTRVTWGNCTDLNDIKVYDVKYPYHPSNPRVEDLPTAKIKVFTPSLMTSDTPITVELESLMGVNSFSLAVNTPYQTPSVNSPIYSLCKMYSTVDRSLIEADPDQYFKRYITNQVKLSSDGLLSISFPQFIYSELIICQITAEFVNHAPGLEAADYNGSNARVYMNTFNLPVSTELNNIIVDLNLVEYPSQTQDFTVKNVIPQNNKFSPEETRDISVSAFTTTADTTPSLTIKRGELKRHGYYSIFKNIPVKVTQDVDSDDILFEVTYYNSVKPFFDSLFLVSFNTGLIHDMVNDNDLENNIYSFIITIKNHPVAVSAYQTGETTAVVDFSLYMIRATNSQTYSFSTLSNILFTLTSVASNEKIEAKFPKYISSNTYTTQNDGKGTYITTRDELMSQYLLNPQDVDTATLTVRINTLFPLDKVVLNIRNSEIIDMPDLFMDFSTVSVTSNIPNEVDSLDYHLLSIDGETHINFFNQVEEYDKEMDIILTLTTLINIPAVKLDISDVSGHVITPGNYREGVTGVAFALGLPQLITTLPYTVLDTSNLNFAASFKKPTLDVTFVNMWNQYYYIDPNYSIPYNSFNIFGVPESSGNVLAKLNSNEHNYSSYSIPSIGPLQISVTIDSLSDRSNIITKTFNPLVYIPDMSMVSDIVRVEDSQSMNGDKVIAPDSELIAFAFIGKLYSRYTVLTIDLRQVPLKIKECEVVGTSYRQFDWETTLPKIGIFRDIEDFPQMFDYQEFVVICKFTHLSTAELREGRYTGVLIASLESDTLGQSTITSVHSAYTVTVPIIESESKKDSVVIDSKVTIRDTPPSGLTPDELDKIKDVYQNSKDTVNGGKDDQVYVSDTDTYPVGDGKYDTDVDITISPSDNGDLSLDEVKDINDQFILDLQDVKDSWNVSVSPPTYGVEVGECKDKCGVGCRLCGIEKSCKVDGDCLSHYCHPTTNTCQVLPNTTTGGDGDDNGDGNGDGDGGNGDDDDDDGKDNGSPVLNLNTISLFAITGICIISLTF